MSWIVAVGSGARKNLRRVPAADQRRIIAALDAMQSDPLAGDVTKLVGQDTFRRRVGNYRIIFQIDFRARAVAVIDIVRRTTTTYR
jgi:mRNA interferase RelE/StbE